EEERTVGRAHRIKSSFVVDQYVIAEKRFLHTKEEIKTSLMQKKELLLKYAQKSPRVLQVLADVYGESQDTSYENLKAALEKNVQDPLSRYNKVINALADIGRTFPRLGTLIWRTKSDLWYLM
ncbi:hypothetical protein KY329_04785, partial [Candidatus Woesearchaeota archaeon]|nr:hypothetical protein [Candidatus Woesearchaeota archaeon]